MSNFSMTIQNSQNYIKSLQHSTMRLPPRSILPVLIIFSLLPATSTTLTQNYIYLSKYIITTYTDSDCTGRPYYSIQMRANQDFALHHAFRSFTLNDTLRSSLILEFKSSDCNKSVSEVFQVTGCQSLIKMAQCFGVSDL